MDPVIRVTVVFIVFMIGFRIIGKRELAQLAPFDLVVLMLLPEIVSESLIKRHSILEGLAGACTLFVLVFITSVLSHRSKVAKRILESEPVILVHNGRLVSQALNFERVTPDEIYTEVHRSGLEKISQVKWAILENDGKITVIPRKDAVPVLPAPSDKGATA